MLQVQTCVSVHCDQCRDALGEPTLEAYYACEAAAVDAAAAAGWRVGPGVRLWCPACGPVLTCEAQGHEFTLWYQLVGCSDQAQVRFGDAIPAGLGDGTGDGNIREYRYCRRCCLHESRSAAALFEVQAGEVA